MKEERTAQPGKLTKHAPSESLPDVSLSRLTNRETIILGELFRNRTNPQIASTLGISRETVKTHVSHILCKLGLRGRGDLAHRRRAGSASSRES